MILSDGHLARRHRGKLLLRRSRRRDMLVKTNNRSPLMNYLLAAFVCALALCLGCYETKYTLSSPDSAKVDRSLVGDYESSPDPNASPDKKPDSARLVVRNLNDRYFYAEWS